MMLESSRFALTGAPGKYLMVRHDDSIPVRTTTSVNVRASWVA